MAERVLSAPGKLFLAGEYAVLWGGVAHVLAVNARTAGLVRRRADRQVVIALPEGALSGDMTPLGVRWRSPVTEAFHVAATTIDLACRVLGREGPGFSLALEPSPRVEGLKLGLGGSARTAVLVSELIRWASEATYDALKLALVAHLDAQRGRGSGADVAASFAGGVVSYRRFDAAQVLQVSRGSGLGAALRASPAVELTRVNGVALPMLFAFSGHSASTPALVKRADEQFSPAQRSQFVAQSDALGAEALRGLTLGHFELVRESFAALQQLLNSIDATRAESLDRVLALAKACGCAVKQSGAGGGDGALLVGPDEQALQDARASLEARGFHCRPITVSTGLQGEAARPGPLTQWLDAADA